MSIETPPELDSAPLAAADRALLLLSLRHGLSDEEVAGRLGTDSTFVTRRRERALDELMATVARAPSMHPDDIVEPTEPSPPTRVDELLRSAAATRSPAAAPAPGPVAPKLPVKLAGSRVDFVLRVIAAVYLLVLLAAVVGYKAAFAPMLVVDPIFGAYGVIVVSYIVSRFVFSAFYRPHRDKGVEPHVAIIMPGFNEEAAIANSLRSLLALDYPAGKLEIVAVNDGSTDGTLAAMRQVEAEAGGRVRVIDFPRNQGKRAAMAAGIRATSAEIVAFVDSDSVLERDALRILMQGFADPKVGAICGHADVLNVDATWLTRMQAVRYFVAFKVVKAAESVFNAVTCCSGCFSAYRREAILPRLDWWENQHFLGRPSTFGDDRSLTNCVLRKWKVRYESRAVSHTIVPETFRQFMKQQLRWKRSWTRESLIVGSFIYRKHPVAAVFAYIGILLPLVAPVIAVRYTIFDPVVRGAGAPFVYALGLYAMALCYGLYFLVRQPRFNTLWVFGIAFCFFYLAFLLWQTYYAVLTSRSASWGTRPATAGMDTGDDGGDGGLPAALPARAALARAEVAT